MNLAGQVHLAVVVSQLCADYSVIVAVLDQGLVHRDPVGRPIGKVAHCFDKVGFSLAVSANKYRYPVWQSQVGNGVVSKVVKFKFGDPQWVPPTSASRDWAGGGIDTPPPGHHLGRSEPLLRRALAYWGYRLA